MLHFEVFLRCLNGCFRYCFSNPCLSLPITLFAKAQSVSTVPSLVNPNWELQNFLFRTAQDFKSHIAYSYWSIVHEPGDSDSSVNGKKQLKLRYMESELYLQVPPEIPLNSSVKDHQDYFTALVCGLTSVSVMNIIEHELNVSVAVPEAPYYATEVQGLRMEECQDPGSKTPSTKSPLRVKKESSEQEAAGSATPFKTPTPPKRKRKSQTPPEVGSGSPEV